MGASLPASRIDEILRTSGPEALDALLPVVYEELKRMARRHRRSHDATLSTTELVHEAFFKLAAGCTDWEGRAHFFGAASRAMRQVLVDFARRRLTDKRGGALRRVTLGEHDAVVEAELDDILALDAALDRLDHVDPRLRRIVELRYFAGLAPREIASLLQVSERTIERDWLKARLILLDALGRG